MTDSSVQMQMAQPVESTHLSFAEIVDLHDDLLLPWLDLYETAFPNPEKILVSTIIDVLKRKADGSTRGEHIISALDEVGTPVGMAMYSEPNSGLAAFLSYMAVNPSQRSRGIGTGIYHEIVNRVKESGLEALVYEVEIPEGQNKEIAQRRIDFYRRQGGLLLKGIHYLQEVGWHQPPIPMHVMIHPIQEMDPQKAFELAKELLAEQLTRIGVLELE